LPSVWVEHIIWARNFPASSGFSPRWHEPFKRKSQEPCLLFGKLIGKLKRGSDISTFRNSQFLAFDSYVFVPGLEDISSRWAIGNTKYPTLIGQGEIGMIKDMNVCQHPRVGIAHDL